ncbi:MAG TPA: carboxypeptidase-like regulatory domain-containing protein, partial [Bryobacteraceae bacterium]|nr:carboxypeptidase-like regulatory domain-containing protein [Bryobacteraceae bacterium]
MKTLRHISLYAIAAIWMTSPAYGQLSTATVRGTITDASGAGIPGAALNLENTTRGASRTAVSDENGRFSFEFVPVGSYRLTVSQPGFETGTRSGLNLAAGQVIDLPMQLA